jgi:hypothetical protein
MLTGQTHLHGDLPPPKGKDKGTHFDGLGTGAEAKKNGLHGTPPFSTVSGKRRRVNRSVTEGAWENTWFLLKKRRQYAILNGEKTNFDRGGNPNGRHVRAAF